MTKINKFTIQIIIIVLLSVVVMYTLSAVQKIDMAQQRIEQLYHDQKQGKRKDPFRCSDAKKHFNQIGVYVDCVQIECEVNDDC